MNQILKNIYFCFFYLLAHLHSSSYCQSTISVSYFSDDTLLLNIAFSEPLIYEKPGIDNPSSVLPILYENLWILSQSESIEIHVIEKQIQSTNIERPFSFAEDNPIGLEEDMVNSVPEKQLPESIFERHIIGRFLDMTMNHIRICPFLNNDFSGNVEWMSFLILRVVGKNLKLITNDGERSDIFRKILKQQNDNDMENKFSKPASLNENAVDVLNDRYPKLEIFISREGIYYLTKPQITAAGWDLSSVDPRYLRIIGSAGEIPIRIIGEGDGSFGFSDKIEFFADSFMDKRNPEYPHQNIYTTQTTYWMELGDRFGLRIGQEEGWSEAEPVVKARSYLFRSHNEKDVYFHRLPGATVENDAEYWFMSLPMKGGTKHGFQFNLESPDRHSTESVKICLKLWGLSNNSENHELEVYLDRHRVGAGSWKGKQSFFLESDAFSASYLKENNNNLTVVNRSTSETVTQLLLDWFEIEYPRLYIAQDDYLRFRSTEQGVGLIVQFEIDGFMENEVDVYKKNISHIYGHQIRTMMDTTGLWFNRLIFRDFVHDGSVEYIAVGKSAKMLPDSIAVIGNGHLRSGDNGADLLMIVHCDTLGESCLEDLIDLRENQGLKTRVIYLTDIYNTFNLGLPHPEAIRRFLRYAYFNWSPSPRFVLLVGDGRIHHGAPMQDGNLIPIPLYQTTLYGATPSDHWYTLLDGDDHLPELAIGRLPIRNRKELRAIVEKILDYETCLPDTWKNQYLMIAHDPVFQTQSETLIQTVMNPGLRPQRLYLTGDASDPYWGGHEALLNYLRNGVGLVNFRGHGGGAIWSDVGLLNRDDVKLIRNAGRLPIITSMTCFTADFNGYPLGEALICQEKTGAIAFWGSTGLGWVWSNYYLLKEFFRAFNGNPGSTLGEIISEAKTSFLLTHEGPIAISDVYQFALLGDPTLSFPFPATDLPLELVHRAVNKQDDIQVHGISDTDNGHITFDIVGYDKSAKVTYTRKFQQKSWYASLPIPPNFDDREGGLRSYVWDSNTGYHANGFRPFTVGKTFFSSLNTVPREPSHDDSIRFSVCLEDPFEIRNVLCRILTPKVYRIPCILDSGRYTTTHPIGPFASASVITYCFLVEKMTGIVNISDTVQFSLPTLPDISIASITLGGNEQVLLQVQIQNLGGQAIQSVTVHVECPDILFDTMAKVDISAYGDTVLLVPFSPNVGTTNCFVVVDPDSETTEGPNNNNDLEVCISMNRFNVTSEFGTTSRFHSPDTVGLPGRVFCYIPPQTVTESTVLLFEELDNTHGLPTRMMLSQNEKIFRISLPGLSNPWLLKNNAILKFVPKDGGGSCGSLPYFWDTSIKKWTICNYADSVAPIIVSTKRLGYFRLMDSADRRPPEIEIQVDNQPFADGSYVPRRPLMSAIIQDKSGILIRRESIHILIDDHPLSPSLISIPDSTSDPRNIVVTFRPELEPGDHTIAIQASDVHGNVEKTKKHHFRVASNLEIQFLGNHPNPFVKNTTFAYVLTRDAGRVRLRIYTVSGKLIRSIEDYEMASADYHEITWDGLDEWGRNVANGVYFFSLTVEGNHKKREIRGWLAKIR